MTLAPVSDSLTRWATTLAPARQLAEIVAGTDFVPAALRGNADACCACIMYGDEIGIGPMQALASIHVVDGRPQPSAELMRAMILRAGHSFTIHQLSGDVARVSGLRIGQEESQRVYVEWTTGMARAAGLLNKRNWQQYPRAMLLARATGDLARQAFPDVVKGLGYVAEDDPDLESWAAQIQPADPVPAATKTITRRRRPRRQIETPTTDVPLPESVPDAAPEPEATDPWKTGPDPWLAPGKGDTPDPPQQAPERPPVAPQAPARGAPQAAQDTQPLEPDLPPPQAMGDRMRKALMAALSRIGIDPNKDREMRLALLSALTGRQLESSKWLTRAEGLMVFRLLSDIESGALTWDYSTETGKVTLTRYRE